MPTDLLAAIAGRRARRLHIVRDEFLLLLAPTIFAIVNAVLAARSPLISAALNTAGLQ